MKCVLDASALLALLLDEAGAEIVLPVMRQSVMSSLNASESFSRAVDKAFPAQAVLTILEEFEIEVAVFDLKQAVIAADLRPKTRSVGASLGDRACLALALTRALPMLTADRRLAALDIGVDIRLIR